MEKDFDRWNSWKRALHEGIEAPQFSRGEVWWCSIGLNIGHEQDGKHELFSRPVLIIRKFNPHLFIGVPLTTKIKHNPYSQTIRFQGREQCVMLSQIRLWDSKRLGNRMGKLPTAQLKIVIERLQTMLSF